MRTNLLFASVAMGLLGELRSRRNGHPTGPGPGSTPPPTPGQPARQDYHTNVEPVLSAKSAGCHVGPETSSTNMFLGQTNTVDSHYDGITGDRAINGGFDPTQASILLKGMHEGPALSDIEKGAISEWLTHEGTERGTDGGGTDPGSGSDPGTGSGTTPVRSSTADAAETQWASCLSVSTAEYQSSKVYLIANMHTDSGDCYSCHEPGGAGGAYWGTEPNNTYLTMLSKWQEEVFITGAFAASAQSTTPVSYKIAIASSKICAKGQEKNNGGGEHPAFDCNQTVGGVQPVTQLEVFRQGVQAHADGTATPACPTPYAFAQLPAQ